jgi:hypothetical protein
MHLQAGFLFDDLIGQHEQFQRDSQAEGIGGLAVDGEEEARRLLDRQVGGFCAVDDLV